jgi:uridine kinase
MQKPVVIGVAGGTGSGKTTVAHNIYHHFRDQSVLMIAQDDYYRDQSDLPYEERLKTNYDHPLSFDTDLLVQHLETLLSYKPIDKPKYDYSQHSRSRQTEKIYPKDVIILEGILVFEDERLRKLMDMKMFVDTDADVRIIRRMMRDIRDRGRSIESVVHQYLSVVRLMHNQFVEPTKRYADIIIPEGGKNQVAVDLLITKVRRILEERAKR